jgi:hypothetical protein
MPATSRRRSRPASHRRPTTWRSRNVARGGAAARDHALTRRGNMNGSGG